LGPLERVNFNHFLRVQSESKSLTSEDVKTVSSGLYEQGNKLGRGFSANDSYFYINVERAVLE
jgi:hypothetical protein